MSIFTKYTIDAFRYPFQDKEWFSKLVIQGAVQGALLFSVIGAPFIFGYMILCARRGLEKSSSLPGWNEWGEMYMLGLRYIAVNIFYILVLFVPLFIILFLSLFLFGFSFSETMLFESTESEFIALSSFIVILNIVVAGLSSLVTMILGIVQPQLIIMLAKKETLQAIVDFRVIRTFVYQHIGTIVVVLGVGTIAAYLSMIGLMLFAVGILFTAPYYVAVQGYIHGIYTADEVE